MGTDVDRRTSAAQAGSSAPGRRDAERERAFQRYVEPEIEVLLRVAQTLTGSWADAEVLVQDTLVRAYRALDRFDGAHPRAWLLTILRNVHRSSLRRQRPDLTPRPGDLDGGHPAFGGAAAQSPEDTLVGGVLGDDLEQAVLALPDTFRRVLLLVDVQQLNYAEAAALLDVPLGTIMSRLSRARSRVRAQLGTNPRARRRR